MEIHISKPGGTREGPFTVEQINASLAQRKYRDTDYWAWYDGLDSWVPLHQVPGIVAPSGTPPEPPAAPGLNAPEEDMQIVSSKTSSSASGSTNPSSLRLFSGMPARALEQIFVFTDGEGPAAMQSKVTGLALREILGAELSTVRDQAPRDVFGRCKIPAQLAEEGRVPASAWLAMSALRPALTAQAKDGAYRICIRTFDTETGQKLAVFLFYNKQKLE